ncbi:MAG: hypothetical protein RBS80_30645 [Thermoguttaceae bacterium]|jgi:hypothetical protein|nr:hypothetical protein [Thermoguttaceae bacterium]
MNMNIRGTLGFAAIAALIGLCLMVFFLATGAASPEPSDHPAWMERLGRTLPGHMFYLIVMFLCLPAFMAASLVASWGLSFWVIACLVQIVFFFGGGLGIAEIICRLKSSRRTSSRHVQQEE